MNFKVYKNKIYNHTKIVALLVMVSTFFAVRGYSFTKSDTIYSTDGSMLDVQSAIDDANDGDTVRIPDGSFVWGDSSTYINLNKRITLEGNGIDNTTVIISDSSGKWTSAALRISAAAIVKGFRVQGATTEGRTPFAASANDFRITGVQYDQIGRSGYFVYISADRALIDNCIINGVSGASEFIFLRGSEDSWTTPSSMGTADNVFLEDCTFNGRGTVCNANSNARIVVRYCNLNGSNKVDGHGFASNTPARSVRHMEVYGCSWTKEDSNWVAIEPRGGTGRIFNNNSGPSTGASFSLREYTCTAHWKNSGYEYMSLSDESGNLRINLDTQHVIDGQFKVGSTASFSGYSNDRKNLEILAVGSDYVVLDHLYEGEGSGIIYSFKTPADYPIEGQIGVGMDPKVAGSEPMYIWNNRKDGSQWPLKITPVPVEAHILYGQAFSVEDDIIVHDRDYFNETSTFDGASGIGIGTASDMAAIAPTLPGVGFWVTDEGEWNSNEPGYDGRLYTWDGSNWELDYTPYTYPHPMRDSLPLSDEPSVSFSHENITLRPGEQIEVDIIVLAATDGIYAMDVNCQIDPTVARIVGVEYATGSEEFFDSSNRLEIPISIDQSSGYWSGALSQAAPSEAIEGSGGVFATMTLEGTETTKSGSIDCYVTLVDEQGTIILAEENPVSTEISVDDGIHGGSGSVDGSVSIPHVTMPSGVQINIYNQETGDQIETTSDNAGGFSLSGLRDGSFRLSFELPYHVSNCVDITISEGIAINVGVVSVVAGDIDNDKDIDNDDFSLLGSVYYLSEGTPGYDENSDLNRDGVVNVQDMAILGSHLGRVSCQVL